MNNINYMQVGQYFEADQKDAARLRAQGRKLKGRKFSIRKYYDNIVSCLRIK